MQPNHRGASGGPRTVGGGSVPIHDLPLGALAPSGRGEPTGQARCAWKRIARAVATTGSDSDALARIVVETTAEYLGTTWAVLALRPSAVPDTPVRLVARGGGGHITRDRCQLPDHVRQLVWLALTRPGSVPVGDGIFVPLRLGGAVQGVLGGVYERPAAAGPGLGATDLQPLTALAGHMMLSLQLDDALRRNAELARRNADLRRTRLEEYPKRIGADERRRLARDLHDGAARQILSVGLAVESCRVQAPLGSPIRTKLDYAKRLAREALDQVRSSIQSLSSGTAVDDADLPTLLHGLRTFRATTDFHLTVDVTGVPIPLAGTATRSLFRIASECLFNTAAHAGARRAIVRLVYGRDALRLVVADDGHGDPQTIRKFVRGEVPGTGNGYHRGLTDIAARVDELGGVLAVERSDLGGVLIEVVLAVPLVRDPETPPGGTDG